MSVTWVDYSLQDIKKETWILTDEGKKYAAEGSPEVQLFLAVPEEGSISKDELQVIDCNGYVDVYSVGFV